MHLLSLLRILNKEHDRIKHSDEPEDDVYYIQFLTSVGAVMISNQEPNMKKKELLEQVKKHMRREFPHRKNWDLEPYWKRMKQFS